MSWESSPPTGLPKLLGFENPMDWKWDSSVESLVDLGASWVIYHTIEIKKPIPTTLPKTLRPEDFGVYQKGKGSSIQFSWAFSGVSIHSLLVSGRVGKIFQLHGVHEELLETFLHPFVWLGSKVLHPWRIPMGRWGYIYLLIYHKNPPNVGKYVIHG